MDLRESWERYEDEFLDDADLLAAAELPEPPRSTDEFGGLTAQEAEFFQGVLAELAAREAEALALYEPLPEQERFHACQASERLVIGGNRGGKTLSTMVELARALTGQDPHGKYSERDGVAICVGLDLRHCAKVFYKLLFEPGAFKVLRDPETGRMRSFRPGLDDHLAHLARPSPPLVPKRFYSEKDISWDNKREGVIKSVKIRATGWTLNFFSSKAAPPQGWKASLVVFDEEIEHPKWYTEVSARLPDLRSNLPDGRFLNGRFVWGATPQSGTEQLYLMADAADRYAEEGVKNPPVVKFQVSLLDNPHISAQAKEDLMRKFAENEDEYNVRILGAFALQGSRVYPELAAKPGGAHWCPQFVVPDDWTRYLALDPGRQVCAALFVAVPPPHLVTHRLPDGREVRVKGRKFLYDEIYLKKSTATLFAQTLKKKLGHGPPIHEWLIDFHEGRKSDQATGSTTEQIYSKALRAEKVKSERTGYSFHWASDDVAGGILAVREGLHLRPDGSAEWCVMEGRCPNFLKEVQGYVYKKLPGTNICTDQPLQKRNHLMDAWRYLAMAKLRYVKPKARARKPSGTAAYLAAKKDRQRHRDRAEAGRGVKLW